MQRLVCGLGLAACLASVGCGGGSGPPKAVVKGTVTVAGKGPLPGGAIRFESVADPKFSGGGSIHPDGTYEAADVPVGECKVVIENKQLSPASGAKVMMPPGGGAKPAKMPTEPPKGVDVPAGMGGGKGSPRYVPLDPKYSDAAATPLTLTVNKGENSKDFEVK